MGRSVFESGQDHELIRRVAQGDRSAFDSLLSRHYSGVVRFLARRSCRADEVDDIAQAVFMHVWKSAGTFRGESSVSTYLKGIALNLHRQACSRPRYRSSASGLGSASPANRCPYCDQHCDLSSPQAASCRAERESRLARVIAELPETARQAIRLRILEERTATDAAAAAQCSLRSLRRHLAQGLALLKKKIDKRAS